MKGRRRRRCCPGDNQVQPVAERSRFEFPGGFSESNPGIEWEALAVGLAAVTARSTVAQLSPITIDALRATKINFIERKPRWQSPARVAGQGPSAVLSGQALDHLSVVCP
jgi:hypothetical protein